MHDDSSRNRECAKRDGHVELGGGAMPRLPFTSRIGRVVPIIRVSQAQEINRPISPLLFRELKTGMDAAPVRLFQSLNHLY